MRVLQKYASNRESMDTLQKHIESINAVLKLVVPEDGPCPPKLREQLRIFREYVHTSISKLADLHPYHLADLTNALTAALKVSRLR